jgi:hypothetical protein
MRSRARARLFRDRPSHSAHHKTLPNLVARNALKYQEKPGRHGNGFPVIFHVAVSERIIPNAMYWCRSNIMPKRAKCLPESRRPSGSSGVMWEAQCYRLSGHFAHPR